MSRSNSRRASLVAGVLAATLLAVTACAGSDTDSGTDQTGGASAGAFPVTLEHKYGSTTIGKEPKRVVTVGLTDQDALLALGVVPVATTEWLGKFPGAIGPWATAKLGGAAVPQVLTDTGSGPQFEKIAALKPDLILSLYSGLTQESYSTLSQIAPTVAQPKKYTDYGIPWQDLTRTAGRAVGRTDQAEKAIADVEARIAEDRKANPDFEGAGGLIATTYEGYFVYGTQDPRSRVLTSLGFELPADLDEAIGDKFGASISAERTELLDRDAIIWLVAGIDTGRAILRKDPLYTKLDVTKEGRDVLVDEGSPYGSATSFISVLSLPYLLDRLVPQLAAAVDGDPKTPVKPVS